MSVAEKRLTQPKMGEHRFNLRRHGLADAVFADRTRIGDANPQFRRKIGERDRRSAACGPSTGDQDIEIGHSPVR